MKRKFIRKMLCIITVAATLGISGCSSAKTDSKVADKAEQKENSRTASTEAEYSDEQIEQFIDTRTNEKEKGPQLVKYKIDKQETTLIQGNDKTGENITTDIPLVESLEENTYQVDQMIQEELESGNYTFEEPFVIQNPYQNAPLTAFVVYTGDQEASVRVTVKGKDEEHNIVDTLDAATQHKVPIVGLYADSDNEVLLEELDADGKVIKSNTINIETESLPDELKDVVKLEEKTTVSAMGLMVVTGGGAPYLYGFDSNGDIRWYLLNKPGATFGGYPLTNGHFLIEAEDTLMPTCGKPRAAQFHEIDLTGRVYQDYFFNSGSHHEIKEKEPDGNLLVLSDSGAGYVQDLLQEYDRKTGEIVKELDLKELFKDSGYVNKSDWAHTNTFSYDAKTDSVIVNPRNLHSAVKINWSTNEIEWILGNPKFWEGTGLEEKVLQPEGDVQWHYQPHTVYQLDEDLDGNPDTIHVMMFDNHYAANRKVDYFDDTGYSYVKSYTIDPQKMTVVQDHVYECDRSQVTSNFLFDGAMSRVFAVCAYAGDSDSGLYGRVIEYDYESGEKLNQYYIDHNFYRGYSIKVDLNSCIDDVNVTDSYLKGTLRIPVEVNERAEAPTDTLSSDEMKEMSVSLYKDILLFRAQNHAFTQVILAGKDHTYVYDISDLKTKSETKFVYSVPIPLGNMVPDEYAVYVMWQDRYVSINQSFTIK